MILESILFGLASAIGLGISDVVAAGVARKMGVIRATVAFQIVTVSVYSLYLLTGTGIGSISAGNWALMAGLSVLVFGFYLSFYKALQIGPVSIVGPILAAHSVIVVMMSVVILGERLTGWQFASISATIGGVVLLSVDVRTLGSGQKILGLGIALGLFASVSAGVWQFSIGAMSRDLGWFLPLYISRVFLLIMLMPLASWRRSWPWQRLTWPLGAAVVVVGVLETGALFVFSRGAEIGLISIVGAASTVYPIFPILGGMYLYKERLAPNQLAGLLVVVLGLIGLAVLR
jgi:drug/metabolite transporter (DMT)-like permease